MLDEADEAIASGDWSLAQRRAQDVLAFDPESQEAAELLEAAERRLGSGATPKAVEQIASAASGQGRASATTDGESADIPTSFAGGRYEVKRFLGEGGKKRVYLAHDTLLDRDVAFALIKTEGFDDTSKERITREAQAMGRLGTHPNIVTVFDLGTEGDSPFMVTELMGGGDVEGLLEAAVKSPLPAGEGEGEGEATSTSTGPSRASGHGPAASTRGGLPLDRTIEIGKAVCDGLQFAHARGIVHRDLKPGNVWLTEDPSTGSGQAQTAKIGDFGLAIMTDRSRLTREGMMVGTVSYMPPEQATGGEITPKADLYSLGAMLYEMVTGRPPFLGDDEIAIIGQHINTPPVAPTWHNGTCPRPLEALIMRLLSKNPSERPESAQDVYNALDAIDLTARGETVEREANSLDSLAGGVFVGRHAEMGQLKAALEDVLGGRGRMVTLVGEPGIGKTRTSEELATYAGLRGAQILWGRCYEGGGAPPYWPWVQAIRSYVRGVDTERLRSQMGAGAADIAEIVSDVSTALPGLQPPPALESAEQERFRLFDSITSFLKTASQAQPLVIVLEDLHWADRPSLAFLEFITRELQSSRILLIGTYRDMEVNRRHPLSLTLGDLTRERLFERVLLRGLNRTDVERFIEVASGVAPPAALVDAVFTQTEGNPLFVTEIVRLLVQEGLLTTEATAGRDTWSVPIPEGIRDVIGRRLDRLSERCNETLSVGAVIGREFGLDELD
ncbi:MAG: protein kinase, partial [Chloroflexi bacterium]|nr:protein kinase [Chloroflexota bacterium]